MLCVNNSPDRSCEEVSFDLERFFTTTTNRAPVADPQTLAAYTGTSLPIPLTGSDHDNDTLSFQVTAQPTHGSLSGSEHKLIYASLEGFVGEVHLDLS